MNRKTRFFLFSAVGLLFSAVVIFAVLFFLPRDNARFSSETVAACHNVKTYLNQIIREKYDKAFEYVSPAAAESGELLKDRKAAQSAWTARVAGLKNGVSSTYLNGFSHLKVEKKNGEMCVSVVLSVTRQGYIDPFYSSGNSFILVWDGGWKIRFLSSEDAELRTDLENALSGYFDAEELNG